MNELMELTENKSLVELERELKFQLSKGENMGGAICSHIVSEINKFKNKNLMFASLGNGITVFDKNRERYGDYLKIAHIDIKRNVTIYEKISIENEQEIRNFAANKNPCISSTQDQKVFY